MCSNHTNPIEVRTAVGREYMFSKIHSNRLFVTGGWVASDFGRLIVLFATRFSAGQSGATEFVVREHHENIRVVAEARETGGSGRLLPTDRRASQRADQLAVRRRLGPVAARGGVGVHATGKSGQFRVSQRV